MFVKPRAAQLEVPAIIILTNPTFVTNHRYFHQLKYVHQLL